MTDFDRVTTGMPNQEQKFLQEDLNAYENLDPPNLQNLINTNNEPTETTNIFEKISDNLKQKGNDLLDNPQPLNILDKVIFISFLIISILIIFIIYHGSVYGNPFYDLIINDPWISTFGI